ncbi:hypothetical protein M0R72_10080 [Candidatus Pacearchaeota archaeon]|nr:hypothetical protein [Candidatus Pacearchaeota archaeon]
MNSNAYMTGYGEKSFTCFDASDPFNPKQLGMIVDTVRLPTPEGMVESTDGNYVFVANRTMLTVVDVSNPRKPLIVATLAGAIEGMAIRRSGNTLFCFGGANISTGSDITAIDVTNPLAPAIISTYAATHAFSGIVVGNYLYYTAPADKYFHILDISNPANMTSVGSLSFPSTTPHSVSVHLPYVYVTCQALNEIAVIDVTTPASPSLVKAISLAYIPWVIDPISSDCLFISDKATNSIHAFDIVSDATTPTEVASITDSVLLNTVDDVYFGTDGYLYASINLGCRLCILEFLASDAGEVLVANKSGNWSDTTLWSDAGGTPLGRIPVAGDEVRVSTYTVALDLPTTPATGRLKSILGCDAAGTDSAGGFTLDTGTSSTVTVSAKRITAGTAPLISPKGSGTFDLSGFAMGGSAENASVVDAVAGEFASDYTVNFHGIGVGGSAAGAYAIYAPDDSDGVRVIVDGTLEGGSGCEGGYIASGQNYANRHTAVNVKGGLTKPGCVCATKIEVSGVAKGGGSGIPAISNTAALSLTAIVYVTGTIIITNKTMPIAGCGLYIMGGANNALQINYVAVGGVGFPVVYEHFSSTAEKEAADSAAVNTTLCKAERLVACPNTQAALPGVEPGTVVITTLANSLRSAIGMSAANLDTQLGAVAVPGDKMDLVDAPNTTAVASIRNASLFTGAFSGAVLANAPTGATAAYSLSRATAGAVPRLDIELQQYGRFGPITITAEVAQTGDSHAFLVYDPSNSSTALWSLTTAGSEISVGGPEDKVLTLTDTDAHTATDGVFAYVLRNTTDDTIITTGALTIVPFPNLPVLP